MQIRINALPEVTDMETFTVYESKHVARDLNSNEIANGGFRVVAGKHVPHTGIEHCTTRVYQGSTMQDAAQAAYSAETRADIKSQIARFFDVESPALRASAIARELANITTTPRVHEFESSAHAKVLGSHCVSSDTDSAYSCIRFGDVLVIPSEQVIGIACGAPFAVTAVAGDLDVLTGSIMHALDGRGVTAPYLRAAVSEAIKRDTRHFPLSPWAYAFTGE